MRSALLPGVPGTGPVSGSKLPKRKTGIGGCNEGVRPLCISLMLAQGKSMGNPKPIGNESNGCAWSDIVLAISWLASRVLFAPKKPVFQVVMGLLSTVTGPEILQHPSA